MILAYIYFVVLVGFFIFGYEKFRIWNLVLLVVLYLLYVAEVLLSTKRLTWPASSYIRKYKTALDEGRGFESIDEFGKLPWYFNDAFEKGVYHRTRMLNYIDINDYAKAYEESRMINEDYFYEQDKVEIHNNQALCLAFMGAYGKAERLLPYRGNNSSDYSALNIYGMIFLQKGNTTEAIKCFKAACDCIETTHPKVDPLIKTEIFNNTGVAVRIINPVESIQYYELAHK